MQTNLQNAYQQQDHENMNFHANILLVGLFQFVNLAVAD